MKERATVICERDGQFLFVRKAESRWALPGGKIEPGEAPADAATRELREETALTVQAITYLFHFGGKGNVHHVFEAIIPDSVAATPHNEISNCGWLTAEELTTLLTSVAIRGIRQCLRANRRR